MNEGKLQSLGQRVVRCRYWRWLPGMLTLTGHRVSDEDAETDEPILFDDDLPDLRDPATVGCLLALVRKVWSSAPATTSRFIYYSPERGSYSSWACTYWRPDADSRQGGAWIQAHGDTEAEALVAALEAAGTQEGE